MRVILDTHFLIWALYDHKRLPDKMIDILSNDEVWAEYSIISLWETELKHQKHPEVFTFDSESLHRDAQAAGFRMMNLLPGHVAELGSLKDSGETGHKDPFDRMLISQAKSENYYLLTHDRRLEIYDEPCVQYI